MAHRGRKPERVSRARETQGAQGAYAGNLREKVRRYGIRFKKALGQNLLLDGNINRIMASAAALSPEDSVVEVGAGLGALTALLAERAGHVLAIEIDPSFMPCLEDQFGAMPHVRLFRGDVLNHDLDGLLNEFLPGCSQLKLVANLPYYITTPLLFHFLESPVFFSRLVVMVQAEVGQRLTANVDTPDYGVMTLAARLYAEVDIVHHVSATCFVPRPKVDSCIVRFRCRATDPAAKQRIADTLAVARAAFAQRRKTLKNSLCHARPFGLSREAVMAGLATSGIDGERRPQTLDMDEFNRLATALRSRLS